MQMLNSDEDLTPHIGAKLRIEKQSVVYEGELKGVSPLATIPSDLRAARRYWLLESSGEDVHFQLGDGWIIHCL